MRYHKVWWFFFENRIRGPPAAAVRPSHRGWLQKTLLHGRDA